MSPESEGASPRPLLSVVSGTPEPEELAALVAVLASRGGKPQARPVVASAWASKGRLVRPRLQPGPNAWRASAWPR